MKAGYSRTAVRSLQDIPEWHGSIIGIDEVGRGSVMGPVITCAVIMNSLKGPECLQKILGDSKKLNHTARVRAVHALKAEGVIHAFGAASSQKVDRLNVFRATMSAMTAALRRLPVDMQSPPLVMVDGPFLPELCGLNGIAVIKGDALVPAIMAASILAKEFRDDIMRKLDPFYPAYGLAGNMGYGTRAHMDGIKTSGITRHHRMSFLCKYLKGNTENEQKNS